jgi:pyocin large subunit-like protein
MIPATIPHDYAQNFAPISQVLGAVEASPQSEKTGIISEKATHPAKDGDESPQGGVTQLAKSGSELAEWDCMASIPMLRWANVA